MNRAPTWIRPAANQRQLGLGRADHPWSDAVERGRSTLPESERQDSLGRDAVPTPPPENALHEKGQHVVLSLP